MGSKVTVTDIFPQKCTLPAVHTDGWIIIKGVKTLRTQDTSDPRHFGTGAEVSVRHFGTSAELSGHFGTSAEVSERHFGTKEDTSAPRYNGWQGGRLGLRNSENKALYSPAVEAKKHIFLDCNASNLLLKILLHDKIWRDNPPLQILVRLVPSVPLP